jgi:hypothetical protein
MLEVKAIGGDSVVKQLHDVETTTDDEPPVEVT